MVGKLKIGALEQARQPTVTDLVYDHLYRQVIENELPPGSKLSEVEVARVLGVSRQPVRDAFYRLSQQGFLLIRPQRATLVTHISRQAVMQAHFIRSALELATAEAAARCCTKEDADILRNNIAAQEAAVRAGNKTGFHALDDEFHKQICELSGHGDAWTLIRDHKAHMDRVRYLSLSFGAESALHEHAGILDAIEVHDVGAAVAAMKSHLSQIAKIVERINVSHPAFFETEDE
ncbi:GntR family transcriptional regulator [Martelella radicis]|uniref:DNA-binding GntR family transcriptional regulator n=1 Tax=Martelella radicis TaxID=1397476 RepID=A0A7W6KGK9_9HYPH|nr:GntR family transcriptional regulator [Martelella radicis]MBB4120884.1 DNA-binding GntR family transcriptional regulator [Martelella radicis]